MDIPPPPTMFPPLPPLTYGQNPWSPHVNTGFSILNGAYNRALSILRQEADPIRLNYHIEQFTHRFLPILQAMEDQSQEEGIPIEWLEAAASAVALIVVHMRAAIEASDGVETSKVEHITPITVLHTGKRGRPRKIPNLEFLEAALSPQKNMSLSAIAELLHVDRKTLSYYVKDSGLTRKFSELSDADLDVFVRTFKQTRPDSGIRYLIGFLRRHGLRIQQKRLRASLNRVDGLGRAIRQSAAITRRKYTSPRPNALWHCDGHHKLIKWGIVIHGFVDGYCRSVTGIRASTNNTAETVLSVFMDAIGKYGTPSRLRGDRGGENVEVSVWMILKRGPNRASFMWGSSTHNTRIERLWVEVGRHFARAWRAFFTRLGNLHRLDRSNPTHLWLLHYLFLDMIQDDCKDFEETWNAHPISGPDTNDRSPNVLRFQGQTENGIYIEDEFEGVHPSVLQQYLGTTRTVPQRRGHQTGAGNPPEEEDSDEEDSSDDEIPDDLAERIMVDQDGHVRHAPVEIPEEACPFGENALALFKTLLNEVRNHNVLPAGYGIQEEEWQDQEYPTVETLKTGRKRKELVVSLPDVIWRPRAELWVQGLDCMMNVIFTLEQ